MNGSRSCQAARCTASRWLASVVAAAVVAAYPVTVAAEQRRDGVAGPASLATAAAVARPAVVTLKLPGRALVTVPALLNIAFLVTVGVVIGSSGGLLEGPLTGLKIALALPIIGALIALGAAVVSARQWRTGAL